MNLEFKCLWRDKVPQQQLPPDLWPYGPLQQVIRSCKCDAAAKPFSIALRKELQYYGDVDPNPSTIPNFASMHTVQIEDVDLFNDEIFLSEVIAKLLPSDEEKKRDIELLLSRYSCLFSTGQSDLGRIANPTPNGKYEWLRMPFGLKNASSTFQRLMDHVVGQTDFTAVYLDDIYVFSEDWKSHLFHVEEVFKQLARNHIKLKLPKSIFGAPYMKALGHIVGNGEMRPDPENVAAILALPVPRDVHMVRSVLGAYGYYHGYVDNFALKTAPMTFLTKNCAKGKWEWSEECQKAYDELKRALTSEPILRITSGSGGVIPNRSKRNCRRIPIWVPGPPRAPIDKLAAVSIFHRERVW
jgi:hypothetical protein